MIPITSDGWLTPGRYGSVTVVRHPQISKTSSLYATLGGKPLGIVWHWTGGNYGSGTGRASTDYMVATSYNDARKASWHFFINKSGEIHQFAPITVATWTTGAPGKLFDRVAGVPVTRDFDNVNRATIGVELDNAGILLPQGGNWYAWPYSASAAGMSEADAKAAAQAGRITLDSRYRVDASRAQQAVSDGVTYDRWTAPQVDAARELSRTVAQALGWKDPAHIHYGHRTFHAKRDPGLLWMDEVLPRIERDVFSGKTGTPAPVASTSDLGALLGGAAVATGAYLLLKRRT